MCQRIVLWKLRSVPIVAVFDILDGFFYCSAVLRHQLCDSGYADALPRFSVGTSFVAVSAMQTVVDECFVWFALVVFNVQTFLVEAVAGAVYKLAKPLFWQLIHLLYVGVMLESAR